MARAAAPIISKSKYRCRKKVLPLICLPRGEVNRFSKEISIYLLRAVLVHPFLPSSAVLKSIAISVFAKRLWALTPPAQPKESTRRGKEECNMKKYNLALLLCIVLACNLYENRVVAVDRTKFRTCASTGFCKRWAGGKKNPLLFHAYIHTCIHAHTHIYIHMYIHS